jgi:hypothetical protein
MAAGASLNIIFSDFGQLCNYPTGARLFKFLPDEADWPPKTGPYLTLECWAGGRGDEPEASFTPEQTRASQRETKVGLARGQTA